MLVKQRLILSGTKKELLHFNNAIVTESGNVSNPYGRNGTAKQETDEQRKQRQDENRRITIQRNKSMFTRLFESNINQYKEMDKFLTLTFRNNPPSIDDGDYQLKRFFRKLSIFTKTKFEYLGTRELQVLYERDGLHYHIILFGLPFVPHQKLLQFWCKGNPYQDDSNLSGVNIKGIKDGYEQIRNYLGSYPLKELMENDFVQGHKTLLRSKGLKLPEYIDFDDYYLNPKPEEIKKALSFISNRITYYQI